MASVATIDLNKSDAHRLADALDFDEPLAALPVALNETPGGGWQVVVYFTAGNERNEATALRRLAKSLFGKNVPRVSVATLPETDWVAKSLEGLPPVRAGRFFVHGGHDRERRHANDIAMRNHAYRQGTAVYEAVGATRTFPTPPYPSTHNLGTNRMSERAQDGVVNKWGQTHDIANLFISDGSQFTTGAAENPTLTIVALAIRQADHIAAEMGKGAL